MGNRVTTLHSACKTGDLAEVHRLLEIATNEDLEAVDDSGRTPLLVAVASLKHLHKHQELNDGLDDFHGFAGSDEEDMDDDDNNATQEEQWKEKEHMILNNGNADNRNSETANEVRNHANMDFLSNEAEILRLLLQHQVNVDHKDENGWTALHHACFVQNAVAITMLIHAGARPMRERFGLLPQDLLQRGNVSEWMAQAQELKESLDQVTDHSAYVMKLLAFRPSGIVQLDMGGQIEKNSFVTLEYDVPETHSVKDYIQMLISEKASASMKMGSFHYVPAGRHGQITISTKDIPSASTIRFVYVKSDINTMSREVVTSGCNAVIQSLVGEIFQYELFLYDRVVEVESVLELEFVDQPLILLKRIGIVIDEDIDWVTIRSDNYIVAVNGIRIDGMEFAKAVRVLQANNGRQCTKLLMQNYSACGDFIPEKILGVGVIGKYAYLHPIDENEAVEDDGQTCEASAYDSSDTVRGSDELGINEELRVDPIPLLPSAIHLSEETALQDDLPPLASLPEPQAEARVEVSEKTADANDGPAMMDTEEKAFSFSTIETVVPLLSSLQLVTQLQHGISIGRANR